MSKKKQNISENVNQHPSQIQISKKTSRLLKWVQKGQSDDACRLEINQIFFGEKSVTAVNGFELRSIEKPKEVEVLSGGYVFNNPIYLGNQIIAIEPAEKEFHKFDEDNFFPSNTGISEFTINPEWLKNILNGMKNNVTIRVHQTTPKTYIEIFGEIEETQVYSILMMKFIEDREYFTPRGDLPQKENSNDTKSRN